MYKVIKNFHYNSMNIELKEHALRFYTNAYMVLQYVTKLCTFFLFMNYFNQNAHIFLLISVHFIFIFQYLFHATHAHYH